MRREAAVVAKGVERWVFVYDGDSKEQRHEAVKAAYRLVDRQDSGFDIAGAISVAYQVRSAEKGVLEGRYIKNR